MSFSPGTTPERSDTQWWILQKILAATNAGGSGGSSGPAATGGNYSFSGTGASTQLRLKNSTTGLSNPISSTGADGTQSVVLDNGV